MSVATRRTLAAVASVAASVTVLAGALAGCSSSSADPATGGSSNTPVSGGSFTVATNGQLPLCIAGELDDSLNGALVARPTQDSVTWQNPQTGAIEPWLATSWTISKNGLVYTFQLRKGVTFSDGSQWNAEAFKTDLDWVVKPSTESPLAAAYLAPYKSSTVLGTYTLQVNLSYPYSAFLRILAQAFLGMISPKQIDDDPGSICTHPIGTGPFKVVNWVKGESVTYVRNDAYDWGPPGTHSGPAYLSKYTVLFIPVDATRYDALTSGQVDAVDYVPPQDVASAEASSNLAVTKMVVEGAPFSFWLNTSRPPFNNILVREALLHGIDRAQIVQSVMFGQYETDNSYLSSSTPDYYDAGISYNVALAKKLLEQAGYTKVNSQGYRVNSSGQELVATFPTSNSIAYRVQIAEDVQQEAKALGIDIVITFPSTGQMLQNYETGDYDISDGIWGTNTPDVLWLKFDSADITTKQRIGLNSSYLDDPTLDNLLQEARETTSATEQAALYKEAQQRLVYLAPSIPFFSDERIVGYNKDIVHGLTLDHAYPAIMAFNIWTTKS
jgi:peptide/nickel transport system substrate-binding protein